MIFLSQLSGFFRSNWEHNEGESDVNMSYADGDNGHTTDRMADDQQSLVIVLDESCGERRFDNTVSANGVPSPQTGEKMQGILSKDDIQLLLSTFDTGLHSLSLQID